MGQSFSCKEGVELQSAVREGNLQQLKQLLHENPYLLNSKPLPVKKRNPFYPLHCAALHGQAEVLSFLLDLGADPNGLDHHKQTPLMVACKNGRLSCIERLIERGADVLMFDSPARQTCLHYVVMSGSHDCLQRILDAGKLPAVAETWGFTRFVNVRDGTGCTPLHLAARFSHSAALQLLLSNGAIPCIATITPSFAATRRNRYGFRSAALHLAAQGGSAECVKVLLSWGADHKQRDGRGHTPYYLAIKHGNAECAALLNPRMAEPLVWPSSWKFISELDPEARNLLQAALNRANEAREKHLLATFGFDSASKKERVRADDECFSEEESEEEVCSICFENPCTIMLQNCGHKMCESCTLTLFCHIKTDPSMLHSPPPTCPFCRQTIVHLKCSTKPEEREEDTGGEKSMVKKVGKGSFNLLSSNISMGRATENKDWPTESSSDTLNLSAI